MASCTAADVRRLTGVPSSILSDSDLDEFIARADRKLVRLGLSGAHADDKRRAAELLASIDVFSRSEMRGGFSAGDFTVSADEVEESIARWQNEVDEIVEYSTMRFRRV